jgi:hypothetical protein
MATPSRQRKIQVENLTEDIQKVDELYLWFVKLKEESIAQR